MSQNEYHLDINRLKHFPTKFLVLYLLFGLLWIALSDRLIQYLVQDPDGMSFIQSLKGWFFVFFTGLIAYYYLAKETQHNIQFYTKLKKNEEEISLSNEAFNNLEQGLLITDEVGYILKVNKQFLEMTKSTSEEVIGERYEKVLQFKAKESYRTIRRKLRQHGHWEDEIMMEDHAGDDSPRYFTLHQVLNEQGQLTNYLGFLIDIKETKQKDNMLYMTKTQLQAILEHSPLGLIACNADGKVNVWNAQAEEILGISSEDAYQKSIFDLSPKLMQGSSSYVKTELVNSDVFKQNKEIVNEQGERKYLQLAYSNLYNSDGKMIGLQVMFSDFTAEREFRRELDFLEHFDLVTGLYNFNTFHEQAESQIKRYPENEHGFLILDIDRFHSINQQYGTELGDQIILAISKKIKRKVKKQGIVARLKGDEFGVFLPRIKGKDEIDQLIEQLQEEFQKPIQMKRDVIHPTISIGISSYPEDGRSFEEIYQKGNAALNYAKTERNSYSYYHPSMKNHMDTYFYENELHQAIMNHEIELYYQPKVNMETGSIQGVEALSRWRHPEQGTISPGVFIPIAEESGLIFNLTDYVIKKACEDFVRWREAGVQIPSVSVNISAKQFSKQDFVSTLIDVLDEYQIPKCSFEIEITESITMDIEHNLEKLIQLRDAGVKISIDDFGTGYSSLKYMRDLPVDFVKIDRSFIAAIENGNEKNMVDFIVDLAKLCEVDIVGEGIETSKQMNYLRSIGCQIGQGYYFSKPLPYNEIEQLYVH